MIILDTCILIYDALTPGKLSNTAKKAIDKGYKKNELHCSDISFWEIAMLIHKNRLDPGTDCENFLQWILAARNIQVLPITTTIATLSTHYSGFNHFDPADRIIVATTLHHHASLITSDKKIAQISEINTVW